jgi:hypothetical protein
MAARWVLRVTVKWHNRLQRKWGHFLRLDSTCKFSDMDASVRIVVVSLSGLGQMPHRMQYLGLSGVASRNPLRYWT